MPGGFEAGTFCGACGRITMRPGTSGSNLRVFDFIRERTAWGHRVYYLMDNRPAPVDCYRARSRAGIRADRSCAGIFEMDYKYPAHRVALAHKLIYPPAVNLLLRDFRGRTGLAVTARIRRHNIDIFLSKARQLVAAPPLAVGCGDRDRLVRLGRAEILQ